MCRADVNPQTADPLAALLLSMAAVLAEREGASPEQVRIGPVDFGSDNPDEETL